MSTCLPPSKVPGTACDSANQCAPPLFCDKDSAAGTGTCQPGAATGAPCNAVSYGSCDDVRDKETNQCTRLGAVGASCDPAGRGCIGYAACLGTTCVARGTAGAACNPTDVLTCLGDLDCFPETETCGFPAFADACR
jgi:hypothetical protein